MRRRAAERLSHGRQNGEGGTATEYSMKLVILHLSDIHVRSAGDVVLSHAADIASASFASAAGAAHVFIVVTGDIAFSGDAAEYRAAAPFLERIAIAIRKECGNLVDIVLVPGNHDCNLRMDTAARRHLIASILAESKPEIDASVIEQCTTVQHPFNEFRLALETQHAVNDDGLWRTHTFPVGTKNIAFECLNISWISQRTELPGTLYFPADRYRHMPDQYADLRVAVLHEPFNWLSQAAYRPLHTLVRRMSDVVLTGHEHVGNVGVMDDSTSGRNVYVEGNVLQEDASDMSKSGFNVVTIELDASRFCSTRFVWNGVRYAGITEGSWVDYHELPRRSNNPLPLQPEFLAALDDPGGPIRHPARQQITLGDLFVFPDLLEITDSPDKRQYRTSAFLANPAAIGDGILLEGDDKSGRTSLLRHLFREYYDRDFYPILIRGEHLNREDARGVERVLRAAIGRQYGADNVERVLQIERERRVVLVDDFDDTNLKSDAARSTVLKELRGRFGYVIAAVNETFELGNASSAASGELLTLDRFRIQPFGYLLRWRLIAKWQTLGADGTLDEQTLLARCDESERVLNDVMKRTLIPAAPLYLITLLQSIEAGRSGEFKDSALGYYYQFLLTDSLGRCGVKADKLTELFQYCAHLAWIFHSRGTESLTEAELRVFNESFSREWHTVDFASRLKTLVDARVLCEEGDAYRFRYPYVFYYLKGQYLSQHLDDLDTRAYVKHCCGHLYVRDHAHTILFLAHHTTDSFVLSSIEEALQGLFQGLSPIAFAGDTEMVAKLMEDVPKLSYEGGQPESHREERNRLRDELEKDSKDTLREKEELEQARSFPAQLTSLLKTTEILGQVLKNQYSKITRKRKSQLLHEVFAGPLRALHACYDTLLQNPEALILAVEVALERMEQPTNQETRKKIARRVVASVVLALTYAFIARSASSANSDSLIEDVDGVVQENGTLAYMLIDLSIALDSPRPLPRRKLKTVAKLARDEPLAFKILQLIVLNRLYMFRSTEKDLQWLSTDLDLSIGQTHKIVHSPQSIRRLTRK